MCFIDLFRFHFIEVGIDSEGKVSMINDHVSPYADKDIPTTQMIMLIAG